MTKASGPPAVLSNGTLTVTGTAAADGITVALSEAATAGQTQVQVAVNGTQQSFTGSIGHVVVNAGDGDDTVTVDGVADSYAGLPDVSVTGGNGNDRLTFENGDNDVTLDGGDGNDTLFADGGDRALVTMLGGAGDDDLTADLDAQASINGGDGNDTITLSQEVNTPETVVGGAGTDTLVVELGDGSGSINLDGKADSTAVGYGGPSSFGADLENLTVTGIDGGLSVAGNALDNVITLSGDAGPVTVHGGDGNDTVSVGGGLSGSLYGDAGSDTFNAADGQPTFIDGGAGTDAATIDQAGDTTVNVEAVTRTGTPTPTKLTGTTSSNSGSYQNSANTAAKSTDGSLGTYFDAAQASGAYVQIDLGTAESVDEIRYAPRAGYASRMSGGVFLASNSGDFSSAVTEYTVAATPPDGALTAVDLPATTAYRYWRYVGPTNGYTNVAEFQLFGQPATTTPTPTPTGTKLTGALIGTTGSYANSGDTIAKAVDGNLSTYFDSAAASGSWVGYDLRTAATITSVSFAPRAGYESRMVGGVFQGSNSPQFTTGVINLYTVTATPKAGVLTTAPVNSTAAFRYVRYLSPTNGYGNVAEVNFFGAAGTAAGSATQLTGTTVGTAGSYQNQGNTIAKAMDGNPNTFFDGPTANGDFIGLDFGTQQDLDQIRFAPRSGYASRMVGGEFQVSTSADFSTGVATVYTVTAAPASGSLTTVTLASPAVGRYVRYLAPNGSEGDVAEVQFVE